MPLAGRSCGRTAITQPMLTAIATSPYSMIGTHESVSSSSDAATNGAIPPPRMPASWKLNDIPL